MATNYVGSGFRDSVGNDGPIDPNHDGGEGSKDEKNEGSKMVLHGDDVDKDCWYKHGWMERINNFQILKLSYLVADSAKPGWCFLLLKRKWLGLPVIKEKKMLLYFIKNAWNGNILHY